ncbi:MAG TPA: TlpA disulfide reductase family protein [Chitinophagaceae bacterium]|nr:TlpA disulfide reductase family protein [Chitinophagaceae bacterium]
MKRRIIFVSLLVLMFSIAGHSQFFSLSDTTITFKNQEGKVLTKDEVRELMKGVFSIHQQNADGKKIITILRSGNDEAALRQAKLEAFKNSLLNKPVKSFRLTDLNGRKWNSKELSGKTVIINFWFTACKPCIQEMIYLNKLVEENKDSSVVFIAPAPENETQIKKFLKKYAFEYNIIPSSTDFISAMNIENFPTHLVIDKEGIIRQVFIGYADDIKEKLQSEINKLIK